MKEYKVITQSDSFWRDKVNSATLEDGLNRLAADGWEVKAITSSDYLGFGKRQEVVIILERERPEIIKAESYEEEKVGVYDDKRIPADRYYTKFGRLEVEVLKAGLLTQEEFEACRNEIDARGGVSLDHAFAYGYLSNDELRGFMKKERYAGF